MTTDHPSSLVYASLDGQSGYAVAARRYVDALRAEGHDVEWVRLRNSHDGFFPAEPIAMGHRRTLLAHCMPQSWAALRATHDPGHFIGQTVWEADQIPAKWCSDVAAADEIWVPTEWNRDSFRAAGFEATHAVPHIVDSSTPQPPPIAIDDSRFVFLTISTWDWRKRPDLVLHAFLQAFTADDPVVLVVKTDPHVLSWRTSGPVERNTWWQVMNIVRHYPHPAEVVLVADVWTDEQVAGLMQRANCYISLTCAEGWGLGAFDAAAAGVPVIITGSKGQTEWLGTDHPGAVPYSVVPVEHPNQLFDSRMTWALADHEAAARLLRTALDPSSALVASAAPLAARLHAEFGAARIGQLMTELLG